MPTFTTPPTPSRIDCDCPFAGIYAGSYRQQHEQGCMYSGLVNSRPDVFPNARGKDREAISPREHKKIFERRQVHYDWLLRIGRELLLAIGEDPNREGIKATPARWARMWRDFIEYDEGNVETAFETTSTNELVMVGPIKVWSKCEHHLVDFASDITIAVKPAKVILGLSKFARIAQKHGHRLQVQEQLVSDIAAELRELLQTDDVAVYARGVHLCIVSRGIRSEGAFATNYSLTGAFSTGDLRHEFLEQIA